MNEELSNTEQENPNMEELENEVKNYSQLDYFMRLLL